MSPGRNIERIENGALRLGENSVRNTRTPNSLSDKRGELHRSSLGGNACQRSRRRIVHLLRRRDELRGSAPLLSRGVRHLRATPLRVSKALTGITGLLADEWEERYR